MFARLAASGGRAVVVEMSAPGGWTLAAHADSPDTAQMIGSSRHDYIVLQEQSQVPSLASERSETMYPAARRLVAMTRANGAIPIFFITWAHRDGWPESGLRTYEDMQFQVDDGYLGIARELGAVSAPVGVAWLMAGRGDSQLDLWQADGSHPSVLGTYLAACVFYATVFRETPEGLKYSAGLPQATAGALQSIASDAVLSNPGQWNLP